MAPVIQKKGRYLLWRAVNAICEESPCCPGMRSQCCRSRFSITAMKTVYRELGEITSLRRNWKLEGRERGERCHHLSVWYPARKAFCLITSQGSRANEHKRTIKFDELYSFKSRTRNPTQEKGYKSDKL